MAQWIDLEAMLFDIAEHTRRTGEHIIAADDVFQPTIGFHAIPKRSDVEAEAKSWVFPVSRLNYALSDIEQKDPMKGKLLRECFKSAEGKRKLCAAFPKKDPTIYSTRFEREPPV